MTTPTSPRYVPDTLTLLNGTKRPIILDAASGSVALFVTADVAQIARDFLDGEDSPGRYVWRPTTALDVIEVAE